MDRRDRKRIVVAFDMRVLLASLLVLCAATVLAQPAKSPAPQNPQKTQNNSAQSQVRKAPQDKDISKQSQPAVLGESNVSANYYEDQDKDKGKSEIAKVITDSLLALFTFALVVVGILQWRVLRKHETWMQRNVEMVTRIASAADANTKAIESQATILKGQIAAMESQNRTMQESVAVARDAAEVEMEKERARLKITVQDIIPNVSLKVAVCQLENYGVTPAFISDFRVRFLYSLVRDIVPDYSMCRQVLYAESLQAGEKSKLFLISLEPIDSLTEDDVMKVRKDEGFIHFYGFVKYQDVFKRDRQANIHVRWTMRWGGTMEGMIMQWWQPVGLPEENADK